MTIEMISGMTVLIPADGYQLTNGEDIAPGSVYLGASDSISNWYEIEKVDAEWAE